MSFYCLTNFEIQKCYKKEPKFNGVYSSYTPLFIMVFNGGICVTLNYIEHFFILACIVTGCISISAFGSLLVILIEIMSSAIGLKICEITAGIKKYDPIKEKSKKKNMAK